MNNRQNVEILAPAGSMDALKAAVSCGADAVYLGAGSFNARRGASNFSGPELKAAIEYCHLRGVKVHLTLNTIVRDNELSDVKSLIECGCAYGADAFIIQDLGTAKLVREMAPETEMHASTQAAVMTAEGFEALKELGFKRIVLPRELSLKEIRALREQTDLDFELFVHGALCMCVSGQCYLSGMLGERSGNRGLCAQPCRLPFGAPGGTGHDLSLKDLDLIPHMDELLDAGVMSFKIEGRMKRPEYAAAAVTACRQQLEGGVDPQLETDLRSVFSRSGFTDGYFTGSRGPQMFGTRQKDDVVAAAPVLSKLEGLYNETARETGPTKVRMDFEGKAGVPLKLTVTDGTRTAAAMSEDPAGPAKNKAADEESTRQQLMRTGGTPFTVTAADIHLDNGLFIPKSVLNQLRRDALDALSEKIINDGTKPFYKDRGSVPEDLPAHRSSGRQAWLVRFDSAEQIPSGIENMLPKDAALILPASTDTAVLEGLRSRGICFGAEVPRALYGSNDNVREQLKAAAAAGAGFAYAGTLDGVRIAQQAGLPVTGNSTLNIFNSLALAEYENFGLKAAVVSSELELTDISKLRGNLKRGIIAYGRTPLMLTRNCPVKNGMTCAQCGRRQQLTDRKGVEFPVRCTNGASELLNSRPIVLSDRLSELKNIDFIVLYFTTESPSEVSAVINAYRHGQPVNGEYTRGLYYRGVK